MPLQRGGRAPATERSSSTRRSRHARRPILRSAAAPGSLQTHFQNAATPTSADHAAAPNRWPPAHTFVTGHTTRRRPGIATSAGHTSDNATIEARAAPPQGALRRSKAARTTAWPLRARAARARTARMRRAITCRLPAAAGAREGARCTASWVPPPPSTVRRAHGLPYAKAAAPPVRRMVRARAPPPLRQCPSAQIRCA